MTTIVWADVFRWVGMIVCGIICLTPVWMVLYWFFMIWAFAGPPWAGLVDRIRERRRKKAQ